MKVVIIGAGIGGLATANLLAQADHEVEIYEQNAAPGGRAGLLETDGFRFDTGPSWYLMPDVFERYFALLGLDVDTELDLQKLTPAYKVFFEHERPLIITGELAHDRTTFEAIESGAGDALAQYVTRGEDIYRLSLKHFLYSNFTSLRDLVDRSLVRHMPRMVRLATTNLHRYVGTFVHDRRLQQILEYPMVFLGTSPFRAPAIYSLMSALDFREGVFYPRGGIYRVIDRLVAYGREHRVGYHFDTPVERILTDHGRATGIMLSGGVIVHADIVISNADLHFTETALLDKHVRTYPESYWKRKDPGPSALLIYLGLNRKIPELEHHNLLFVDDWRGNFDAIEARDHLPDPASIYICKASATDPSVAPAGHENVFVLVPLPAGKSSQQHDVHELTTRYLDQIKRMTGIDLSDGVVTKSTFAPIDFAQAYNAWQGTMLGLSHRLSQSAFFRTKNKSRKLKNLYYVGANTLPGIGLPMCLIGAELVAQRIKQEQP